MMLLISKKAYGKRKDKVFRRENWLMHHVKLIYILILFLKTMLHQEIYAFWFFVVNYAVQRISSQVEQIEVFQKAALLGIFKLNDSSLDKKQRDLTQFFPKKDYRKRINDLILPIVFTISLIDGRVIE